MATFKDVDVEKVLSILGERIRVYPAANYLAVHLEYLKEREQKENFCGAFTASYVLRGMGVHRHGNEAVDQDYIAVLAKVNVDPRDLEKSKTLKQQLKSLSTDEAEKTMFEHFPILYRFDNYPTTLKDSELGASAEGVVHAVEESSMGRLKAIPLKTFSREDGALLTREKMSAFLDFMKKAEEYGANFIMNLNTKHLLDSEKIPKLSEKLLLGEGFREVFRESMGHYVGCGGLVEVDGRQSLIVRETYQRFGVHLQPAEYVRQALLRNDGREGGIILVVPSDNEEHVREVLRDTGFRLELWDNGSPFVSGGGRGGEAM